MLTYIQVLLAFVVPPILGLFLIYRPLLGRRDGLKLLFLAVIATVYTTPWDNFIIASGGWSYPPSTILGTISHVPIEEHMFFILQPTLLVLLHCVLSLPVLVPFDAPPPRPVSCNPAALPHSGRRRIRYDESSGTSGGERSRGPGIGGGEKYQTLERRPVVASLWIGAASVGAGLAAEALTAKWYPDLWPGPKVHTEFGPTPTSGAVNLKFGEMGERAFYLGFILVWICPVIALLTFLGARVRPGADRWTLILGTSYLWAVDTIAIRAGAWSISPGTSLGIELWRGLPVEEAIFFFLTTYLIVLSCSLITHLHALLILAPSNAPLFSSFPTLWRTLVRHSEGTRNLPRQSSRLGFTPSSLPPILPACPPRNPVRHIALLICLALDPPKVEIDVVRDLTQAEETLRRGSKSFDLAKLAFGREMRIGLVAIYAWCRVTDNLIDEPFVAEGSDATTARLQTLSAIRSHLAQAYSPFPSVPDLTLSLVSIPNLSRDDASAFYLFANLVPRLVPLYPFLELCDGYATDTRFPIASSEDTPQIGTHPGRGYVTMSKNSALEIALADPDRYLPIRTMSDLLVYADNVAGSVAAAICHLSWSVLTENEGDDQSLLGRHLPKPSFSRSEWTDSASRYLDIASSSSPVPSTHARRHASASGSGEGGDSSGLGCERQSLTVQAARRMGRALQLVNIARDVVKDSRIGRVYVPLSSFPSATHLLSLLDQGGPDESSSFLSPLVGHSSSAITKSSTQGPGNLADLTIPLLTLASQMRASAGPHIESLPRTARGGTRAMVASYFEISTAIQKQRGVVDDRGVRVSKWNRAGAAAKAMWIG